MRWQTIFRTNIRSVDQLADRLELTPSQRALLLDRPRFALNIPERLVNKMAKGTLDDPLLRQFVALKEEEILSPTFQIDPVGDCNKRRVGQLLHKYQGRVLLICSSACAMHCRYCFRQNFDYAIQDHLFEEELATIASDPSIREVILSGGDPLALSDHTLEKLLKSLSAIPHVEMVRFHTRFPIGIPERIDASFLALFEQIPRLRFWIVIHANHPRELDLEVLASLAALQQKGVILLNQAVLLKGVNDDLPTLYELCYQLAKHGVLPYYLHQLDRVQGSSHFEVPESQGLALMAGLRESLPGYAVPRYVREVAGEKSKTSII